MYEHFLSNISCYLYSFILNIQQWLNLTIAAAIITESFKSWQKFQIL